MTAKEFTDSLRRRLSDDPEYRAEVIANEARKNAAADALTAAEAPILDDLRRVRVRVNDLWELDAAERPAAIPVLVEHLERGGYPDEIISAIGNCLAVKPASDYWDRLRAIYLHPRSPVEEEAAAVALSGAATRERYGELVAFLKDDSIGPYRSIFMQPIVRFGRDDGWKLIESLRAHPVLGDEAVVMLRRRERRLRRSTN